MCDEFSSSEIGVTLSDMKWICGFGGFGQDGHLAPELGFQCIFVKIEVFRDISSG